MLIYRVETLNSPFTGPFSSPLYDMYSPYLREWAAYLPTPCSESSEFRDTTDRYPDWIFGCPNQANLWPIGIKTAEALELNNFVVRLYEVPASHIIIAKSRKQVVFDRAVAKVERTLRVYYIVAEHAEIDLPPQKTPKQLFVPGPGQRRHFFLLKGTNSEEPKQVQNHLSEMQVGANL